MGPRAGLLLRRASTPAVALLAVVGLLAAGCARPDSLGGTGGGAGCGPGVPAPGGELPTSPTSVPEIPATTIAFTPPRPSPLVAVGVDGAVVTLNSYSGERTAELAPAPRSGAVVGVTLSADRTTAWFDVCRLRGVGAIYQVPVDGSAPARRVATGAFPEASPTANRLAYLAGRSVVVRDLATGTERRWTDDGTGRLTWLAWTSGGTELLWVRGGSQLVRLSVDTPGARPQAVPNAVAGPGEVLYATLNWTVLVGDGPDDPAPDRIRVDSDNTAVRERDTGNAGARDRAFDASGHWSLRTDAYGNLVWSVGGGLGLLAEGYLAADW